jgi:hypothetical protein
MLSLIKAALWLRITVLMHGEEDVILQTGHITVYQQHFYSAGDLQAMNILTSLP